MCSVQGMADDSETSDSFSASRNNWELVSLKKIDHVLEKTSSSASGSDEPFLEDHTLINVDYFAVPSTDPSCDAVQKPRKDLKNGSSRMENAESPPPTTPELDWIEPAAPIQSCVIGTSEDDDSSSRSCSDDSREGSTEQILKEKDASSGFDSDPYISEYTEVLRDVPMDAIGESRIEPPGVMNDASTDEGQEDDVPWRRCWLSEAGQASTVCSIALAAAIIGLVLVGSGWHRIRLQYQKFRCRFFLKGKGIIQVMHHLIHTKGSSSKLRRVPVLKDERCCSRILNDHQSE